MTEKDREELLERIIQIGPEIYQDPCTVVRRLTGYKYVVGEDLREVSTNSPPPRRVEERAETIPIDECLGLYDHAKIEITIFEKGIEDASKLIKCKVDHLREIVRLHEWSHAILHIGFTPNDALQALKDKNYRKRLMEQANKTYLSIEPKLQEHLVQLLTYHSLKMLLREAQHDESKKAIGNRAKTFDRLCRYQPTDYRIDRYRKVRLERIIESLRLLKNSWLVGKFEAWDIVVKGTSHK